MGNTTTAVQSAAREHTIRLSSLKVVLHERCIETRPGVTRVTNGTCVALTAHTEVGACGSGHRNAWGYRKHLGMTPSPVRSGVRWMHPCDLVPVVKKVRTLSGLSAVKKTWGVGYKALLNEIQTQPGVRHG